MPRACLLLMVTLSGADGGRQELREELRHDLAWVVPPGWGPREVAVGDVVAGDPQDPFAVVVVLHVPSQPDRPIDIDFLRKATERSRTSKTPVPTAMVGTCSDGRTRFACEELQTRYHDQLAVDYAWVDRKRGWGFFARYTLPRGREDQMLPLVRGVVGWRGTRAIAQ